MLTRQKKTQSKKQAQDHEIASTLQRQLAASSIPFFSIV